MLFVAYARWHVPEHIRSGGLTNFERFFSIRAARTKKHRRSNFISTVRDFVHGSVEKTNADFTGISAVATSFVASLVILNLPTKYKKKKMKDKTARDLYRYHRLKQLRRLHTRRRQRRRQRRRAIVNAIKYTHDFSRFSQLPLVARFSAYILLRDEILPPKQFCSFLFSPPFLLFCNVKKK